MINRWWKERRRRRRSKTSKKERGEEIGRMTPTMKMTHSERRRGRRRIDTVRRRAEATKAEKVFCADCRRVSTSLPTDAVPLPTQTISPPTPPPTPPSAAEGAPTQNAVRNVRSTGEEAEEDEEEKEEYRGNNRRDAG